MVTCFALQITLLPSWCYSVSEKGRQSSAAPDRRPQADSSQRPTPLNPSSSESGRDRQMNIGEGKERTIKETETGRRARGWEEMGAGVGRGWPVRKRQRVGETKTKRLWGWVRCWIRNGWESKSFFFFFFWNQMSTHVNTCTVRGWYELWWTFFHRLGFLFL